MSWIKSIFGNKEEPPQESTSSLDIVVYMAGLASNPKAIDQHLDKVREISAMFTPESGLTTLHEQILTDVYILLEDYLTTKDPLRSFTKQEIRQKVEAKFNLSKTTPPPL